MNLEILGDGKRKRRIKDLCEVDYSKKGSEKPEAERKPNPSDKDSELEFIITDRYSTYANGLHIFREECGKDTNNANEKVMIAKKELIRPPTIKEILEFRLEQFHKDGISQEEREKLFKQWFATSTGIAYQKDTNNFKIVPVSLDLMGLQKDFNQETLPIDYSKLVGAGIIEVDKTQNGYDISLTKAKVKVHKGWLALCENDSTLLNAYVDVVYGHFGKKSGMRFYLSLHNADHLRSVYVDNLDGNSYDSGILNSSAYFLRVTRAKNFSTGNRGRK